MNDTEIDVSPLLASPGFDPWDCFNSVANLGPDAGRLTWRASQRFTLTSEDVHDWLGGRALDVPGFPVPPDTYHPGHVTWGANPKRSRAIMNRRALKARTANEAAFRELLPHIAFATPGDALDVARTLQDFAIAEANGWQLWRKDSAQSWIHSSDASRLAQAQALGAVLTRP